MKFNETTHIISIGVLILTAVYTLVYSGISGVLLCAAVVFIAAAFIDPLELVVAITILFVLLYTLVLKRYIRLEGFKNNPTDITNRLRKERNEYESTFPKVSGTAKSYEGFEDASNEQDSKPATEIKEAVNPTKVNEVTAAVEKEDKKDKNIETEEFQSATNQLFKLGKMPSEHKEGPMLDAGGTLMKAMSSFDPDTTKKMTEDTKQLLTTQKSLMDMLTQMRPILADGKELLQTFSGMFGGSAGASAANTMGQFKL
jgi:hypothetical protein